MSILRYCFLFPLVITANLKAQSGFFLPAHTPVQLSSIEEAQAEDRQAGDLINLKVLLDVRIDGKLVIRNGAFAQAQVRYRYLDPRRKKPVLVLVPVTVQAIDGSLIPLYGEGLSFGGRGPSARPALVTGSKMTAAIRYATKIFLK